MAIEKMMIHANDKYVANYVVYGKTADKKLYYDAAYKEQVTQSDAEDAFLKGRLIIKVGTDYIYPVSLSTHKIKTIDASGTPTVTTTFTEWLTKE